MNIDDLATVSCQGCGVYDASLRCSSHPVVVSLLVTANQSANTGVWCARCRAIESAKAAAITLLGGWWSLRGPALTIAAVRANLAGGEQNVVTNAQLLRGLAHLESGNRNFEFASMFARAAHTVQPQRDNSRLIDELSHKGHRNALPDSMWRYVPLAPLIIFIIAVGTIGLRAIKGGDEPSPNVPTTKAERLAMTGTPPPVINRSFQNEDLGGSADELEKRLTDDASLSLGRAYIRARLNEARAAIPTRVRNGEDLLAIESSISAMRQNRALDKVFASQPARDAFDRLTNVMMEATRYYHGGAPVDAIERTAGESMDVSVDMTVEAIDNEMRGHSERADALGSEADRRLESIVAMKVELRMRGAVISTTTKAIDGCLYAIR
jgi:hypothetical protein